ncbi:hypothetical protein [Actinophytocola sp.]|uniref:hypothetical protein n=1 Tax=Actinophytocola sp. TaxID=1872138 RepID=UPI0025BE4D1B|nr:hypothetical protein [Actinophytocola sp.]
MYRLGAVLAIFGFGSALLHFTSVQFKLLMWSEPMQPGLGLAIGGVGAVVLLVKVLVTKEEPEQPAPAGPPQYGQPPQAFGQPPAGPQQFGPPPQGFAPQGPQGPPQGFPPRPAPQGAPQQFGPQGGPPHGPRG